MPNTNNRPVPVSQPESDHYWEQAKQGNLVLQKCSDCASFQFYPRVFCTTCSGRNLEWIESAGEGFVFTFAIVHQPFYLGFVGAVPYITAIVELDEGVTMPSQLIGVDPEPHQIEIGMRVRVAFEELTDSISLPVFRPIS